jgi:hypothetical protein
MVSYLIHHFIVVFICDFTLPILCKAQSTTGYGIQRMKGTLGEALALTQSCHDEQESK